MPPDIKIDWDENVPWNQAQLIAYNQIREIEDNDSQNSMLKAILGVK